MSYDLGIDLGNANSAAFICDENDNLTPVAFPIPGARASSYEAVKPVPSAVAYSEDGEVIAVGEAAKQLAADPEVRVIVGAKRLLTQSFLEAAAAGEIDRYRLPVEPDPDTGQCAFEIGGRFIAPLEVVAEILRHIHRHALATGLPIDRVILAVPAHSDAAVVAEIVEAARRAGIGGALQTVPEPVAAALAAGVVLTPRPVRVLCVDVGRGTTDVAAVELSRSGDGPTGIRCRNLANGGDNHLGGVDFDGRMQDLLVEALDAGALSDRERAIMAGAAEQARIRLSADEATVVEMEQGGRRRRVQVSRAAFEAALRRAPDLLAAIATQIVAALEMAGWSAIDVDHVFLVGGPAATPAVRKLLLGVFGRNGKVTVQLEKGLAHVDPMLGVAMGAARFLHSGTRSRHPFGYGFVKVSRHRRGDRLVERREAQLLIPPNGLVGETHGAALLPAPVTTVRGVGVDLVMQVPDSERIAGTDLPTRYRYLGTVNLGVTEPPFAIGISMRLTGSGELETELTSMPAMERLCVLGTGAMARLPIDMPCESECVDLGSGHKADYDMGGGVAMREWCAQFLATVRRMPDGCEAPDAHLDAAMDQLARALAEWHDQPADATACYNAAQATLARAFELRLIDEMTHTRRRSELDAARAGCFRWVSESPAERI